MDLSSAGMKPIWYLWCPPHISWSHLWFHPHPQQILMSGHLLTLCCKHLTQAHSFYLIFVALIFLQCSEYQQKTSWNWEWVNVLRTTFNQWRERAKWDRFLSVLMWIMLRGILYALQKIPGGVNPKCSLTLVFFSFSISFSSVLHFCSQGLTSKEISYIQVCEQGSGVGKPYFYLSLSFFHKDTHLTHIHSPKTKIH